MYMYEKTDRIWDTTTSATQPLKIYNNSGKGRYLLFHDDDTMGYIYILWIPFIWMVQLNTYSPTYCKEAWEGNQEN